MLAPRFLGVGKTTLTIKRTSAGIYDANGDYIETPGYGDEGVVTITAVGNLQPNLTRNEMMLLPEGERSKQTLKFYTATPLRMRREGEDGHNADEFDWTDANGETNTYQVMKVMNYQMGVLNHWKCLCVRKERT